MAERHKGILLPTSLRTKELGLLPVWVRERAFFMATVDRAEVLQAFSTRVDRIARGELTVQEARQEISTELGRLGYEPQAGQEGTIKDLRTVRRQNVALETNLAQLRGYGRWQWQQEALRGFPAQRFVRLRMSAVRRSNWPERFAAAVAGTTAAGANVAQMVALVNHPCWVKLSVFGTPYAPFDFGSGMGIEPMGRAEALELGLLPSPLNADAEHAAMLVPQDRGLNESLEATPAVNEARFRMAISEAVQGFGEWEGKKLVFTDPNGTRPYTAEALAEVWRRPLPAAFADLPGEGQMQREAFVDWVSSSHLFEKENATDKWEDLQRVHARLKNEDVPEQLYRGMKMAQADVDAFVRTVQEEGYGPQESKPVESWTDSPGAAQRFARTAGEGWSVIVEAPAPNGALFKDASALVREFASEIRKKSDPPVQTESEWLLATGTRFLAKIQRDAETRTIRVKLQAERGTR